jgi:hypothetical protein
MLYFVIKVIWNDKAAIFKFMLYYREGCPILFNAFYEAYKNYPYR